MSTLTKNRLSPFFSLGGALSLWWQPRATLLPWACTASALVALALWDWLARSGNVDFILLGLSAYELVIGLTE